MKFNIDRKENDDKGRTPHGVRGLKLLFYYIRHR